MTIRHSTRLLNRFLWSRLVSGLNPHPSRDHRERSALRALTVLALLLCAIARAEINRVVIIKVDGLPERLVERYVAERADGARQGHSRLPWIEHVFGKNGVWMENFYVRGLSLSAPSWSLLDTGRHLEIRGNAEFDRYTLRGYDYLNFFPLYISYAFNRHADMPGVELLDENRVSLLIDRFGFAERYQSFQLLQRGVRWETLESSLKRSFGKPLKELFDEWQMGFTIAASINPQAEHELLEKLRDPRIHYLDYFTGEYDHTAHLTNDRVAQFHVIEQLDALVGRVWAGIAASPLARTTMLVVVSDHGMNTSEDVYSQGYNLVDWFTSEAGGAHHVLMNRHPREEFKLRGLDPLVSEVITPSPESAYLAGEAQHYPTAVLDLDGNERASISLRNNSLNMIQILLDQLMHKKLSGRERHAVLAALFQVLGRVRPAWSKNIDELSGELKELRVRIEQRQQIVDAHPRQWTAADRAQGLDQQGKRDVARLESWKADEHGDSNYVAVMSRLLSLEPSDFDPGKFKTEELIPRRSLGEPNSIADLRHYVVGLAPGGLAVQSNGLLDMERSFRYIDYFAALGAIHVRNNVQKKVGDRPIDFIAAAENGAIRLWRADADAAIEKRANGAIRGSPALAAFFELPLAPDWTGDWHSEREWLDATHRTKYSNAVIGLTEELLSDPSPSPQTERKRELRRADMIAFANDHWNFNVRAFNPGGNHGSFLRASTHSVLMFAGGDDAGIPRGLRVAAPYDSLSLVPTILALMGRAEPDLPGPVIREIVK